MAKAYQNQQTLKFLNQAMEKYLNLVKEQPSVEIDEARLRQFLPHIKVWDFAKISQQEYQALPATNRFSILKDYYTKMLEKYGSDISLFCFFCCVSCLDFCLCFISIGCFVYTVSR